MATFEDCQARFTGGSTTITGDYPASIASGDDLLMYIAVGNTGTTITTPAGWTLLQSEDDSNENAHSVYHKTADGSETGTIDVTISAASGGAIHICRVTGANGVDASAKSTPAFAGTTHDSPSVTTAGANQLVFLFIYTNDGDDTFDGTVPSGSSAAPGEPTLDPNFFFETSVAYFTQVSAGATGAQQWTTLTGGSYRGAFTVTLLNDGGGPASVYVGGTAQRNRRHSGRYM